MTDDRGPVAATPIWVDLATNDPGASRAFYRALFGWEGEPVADPAAGGYAVMQLERRDVAGIGPSQDPEQPAAWNVYIGSENAETIADRVRMAGGTVIAPPFDVFDQGRMAVFQDPSGAFFSIWQPMMMRGAQVMRQPNSVGWCELNSRDIDAARRFYREVFGWDERETLLDDGTGSYVEFQVDGRSVCGGMAMASSVPAEVPSHWMVYFLADDIDASCSRARDLGGRVVMEPNPYPGGRFAVLSDPQGATFGLMSA
ncbi:MAG TPA: VOC family protein [Candidatus Dormibacteraeota bacterium]|nr:VOC family protein [Candidatus Dormibacteraeota bacterium]